eukprot:6185834-Ditylum_brightwellii.AAC.1
MAMYLRIVYKKIWKEIKFLEEILNYITKYAVTKFFIQEAIKKVNCDGEKVVDTWKNEYQDVEDKENTNPNFFLLIQKTQWGQPPGSVEATVVVIQSTAKDAQYLKTLILEAYRTGMNKEGVFVPQGLYMTVGKDAVSRPHFPAPTSRSP